MFESSVLQTVANEASPVDAMWDIVRESQPESVPASNVHYVIYGCALLIGYPGVVRVAEEIWIWKRYCWVRWLC